MYLAQNTTKIRNNDILRQTLWARRCDNKMTIKRALTQKTATLKIFNFKDGGQMVDTASETRSFWKLVW